MAIDKVNMNGFRPREVKTLIDVFDHACEYLHRDSKTATDVADAVMAEARLNGCTDAYALFKRVIHVCADTSALQLRWPDKESSR